MKVKVTDSSTPAQVASSSFDYSGAGLDTSLARAQVGTGYVNSVVFRCATDPVSWTVVSGATPPGLIDAPFPTDSSELQFYGTPTSAGTYSFVLKAVDGIGRAAQQTASLTVAPALMKITDVAMQLGVVGRAYHHVVPLTGGLAPYTFAVSAGALAPGLQLNAATGEISGTPTTAGYSQFNVQVTDSQTPQGYNLTKAYMLLVTATPLTGRNDTLATATAIVEGTYFASLSPYADASGTPAPDQDYYTATLSGGHPYTISANSGLPPGALGAVYGSGYAATDPVIEILNSSGARLALCDDAVADYATPGAPYAKGAHNFTDPCISHAPTSISNSVLLTLQVPSGPDMKIYIHVFDFEGRARPDFTYTLGLAKVY